MCMCACVRACGREGLRACGECVWFVRACVRAFVWVFARCPPRVRVAAVRLDIRTTVKRVQTSQLPRIIVILVLLIQTSRDVDTCVDILDTLYGYHNLGVAISVS